MGNISHQTSPSSSHQKSLFSNPLISSIVTLYILILLYFPPIFIKTILSPILISTLILLLSLLRLGTSQQHKQASPPQPSNVIKTCEGANAPSHDQIQKEKLHQSEHGLEPEPKPEPRRVDLVLKQHEVKPKEPQCDKAEAQLALEPNKNNDEIIQSTKLCLGRAEPKPAYSSKILLEWDVGAPLEVIYEAYEGEEGGEEVQNDEFWRNACCNHKEGKIDKYPSLSRYYPETDSDSDSDSNSDSDDDEAEKDGLIEIALDYGFGDKRIINVMMKVAEKKEKEKVKEEFYFDDHEEDNLIEIDISSTKNMYDFVW